MRLFISGIAAVTLLSAPMTGCKKDAPADAPAAAAGDKAAEGDKAEAPKADEAAAIAEGEKAPEGEAAGGAEKPAEEAPKADEVKAEVEAEVEVKAEEVALPEGVDADAIEAGIKMMESFGTIMATNKDDCDALAKAVTAFNEENGEKLKAFSEKMQSADAGIQKVLEVKYKDRMEKTIGEIMMGGMACQANENFTAAMKAMEGAQADDESDEE